LQGGRIRLPDGEWDFVLPRTGKTILVHAPKRKKVVYKFTWNGEKCGRESKVRASASGPRSFCRFSAS